MVVGVVNQPSIETTEGASDVLVSLGDTHDQLGLGIFRGDLERRWDQHCDALALHRCLWWNFSLEFLSMAEGFEQSLIG